MTEVDNIVDPPLDTTRGKNKLEDEEGMGGLRFRPPLYKQRYIKVADILREENVSSVVDFGCAECKALRVFRQIRSMTRIIGVDLDHDLVENYKNSFSPQAVDYIFKREKPLQIELYSGDLTQVDSRLVGVDAVTLIEVIEHLDQQTLGRVQESIFTGLRPRLVVMTTPNSEFNVLFPYFSGMRHWDHKFEWTRQEFQTWCCRIADVVGYDVKFGGIGDPPDISPEVGHCSQMAIFKRQELTGPESITNNYDQVYTQVCSETYPYEKDITSTEDKLVMEVDINLRRLAVDYTREHDIYSHDPDYCDTCCLYRGDCPGGVCDCAREGRCPGGVCDCAREGSCPGGVCECAREGRCPGGVRDCAREGRCPGGVCDCAREGRCSGGMCECAREGITPNVTHDGNVRKEGKMFANFWISLSYIHGFRRVKSMVEDISILRSLLEERGYTVADRDGGVSVLYTLEVEDEESEGEWEEEENCAGAGDAPAASYTTSDTTEDWDNDGIVGNSGVVHEDSDNEDWGSSADFVPFKPAIHSGYLHSNAAISNGQFSDADEDKSPLINEVKVTGPTVNALFDLNQFTPEDFMMPFKSQRPMKADTRLFFRAPGQFLDPSD